MPVTVTNYLLYTAAERSIAGVVAGVGVVAVRVVGINGQSSP
jgi:hypothetical protein